MDIIIDRYNLVIIDEVSMINKDNVSDIVSDISINKHVF